MGGASEVEVNETKVPRTKPSNGMVLGHAGHFSYDYRVILAIYIYIYIHITYSIYIYIYTDDTKCAC